MLNNAMIRLRLIWSELRHATDLEVVNTRRHLATHYRLDDLEDDDRLMVECQHQFDQLDRSKAKLAGIEFYQPKEMK